MTDELLYERLALSVDRLGTVVPHVHGETVANLNQLYPLILSIPFRHGQVLHGLHEAHVLNAFVMTSAALPAYLLARRVTHHGWVSLAAAFATATVVWITLASFLLTEVAAYPAFVWALLAAHVCVTRPSALTDLLAVAGIALAVLARTQFYVLAAVLAIAIVAQALTERQLRATLRRHVVLCAAYAICLAAAIAVSVTGHHVLGTYAQTAKGNPLPAGIFGSVPAHLAIVALARRAACLARRRRLARRQPPSEREQGAADVRVARGHDGRCADDRGRLVRHSLRRQRRPGAIPLLPRAGPVRRPRRGAHRRSAALVRARPARAPRDRLLADPVADVREAERGHACVHPRRLASLDDGRALGSSDLPDARRTRADVGVRRGAALVPRRDRLPALCALSRSRCRPRRPTRSSGCSR